MSSIDPDVPFPFHSLKGDPLSTTDGRLTGAITIAGTRFWCEALPVKNTEDIRKQVKRDSWKNY